MRALVVAVTEAYEECERVRWVASNRACTTRDVTVEESLIRCWWRSSRRRAAASTSTRRSGDSRDDMVRKLEYYVRSTQSDLLEGNGIERDDAETTRIAAR